MAERASLPELVVRSLLYLRYVSEMKQDKADASRFSDTAYQVASSNRRWDCLAKTLIDIGEQLAQTSSADSVSILNEAQKAASDHQFDRLSERCFLSIARIHLLDGNFNAVEQDLLQVLAVETLSWGESPRAAETKQILRTLQSGDSKGTLEKLNRHLWGAA
jgi:hypothetical protein